MQSDEGAKTVPEIVSRYLLASVSSGSLESQY